MIQSGTWVASKWNSYDSYSNKLTYEYARAESKDTWFTESLHSELMLGVIHCTFFFDFTQNLTFSFIGSSDSNECANQVRSIFKFNDSCPSCTFDNVYQPDLNGNYFVSRLSCALTTVTINNSPWSAYVSGRLCYVYICNLYSVMH